MATSVSLNRRIVAEGTGTTMLLAAVVGSGIMADQLSGGNQALALLANTIASGAARSWCRSGGRIDEQVDP